MRIAIIDIGTNTINLLVADTAPRGYNIIYSSKVTARLGKGGLNDGIMTEEAMERGVKAIETHMATLATMGTVDKIVAIGTSAMREASNSHVFLAKLKEKYDIDVRIISGKDEAHMIYDGVKQVMPIGRERVLILDIGGGSCEFVIADKDGMLWAHSFELGMSRLLDKFTPSDPITRKQINEIENYLRPNLMPLYEALKTYPTSTLIGTSGSFDTVAAIVAARKHPAMNTRLSTSYEIPLSHFDEVYQKIITSTAEQRRSIDHMDTARIDLIVMGVIFINFIMSEMKMERLFQCSFALKQGAIFQIVNGVF